MLTRIPTLYVLAAPTGEVTFSRAWDAGMLCDEDAPVPLTWADADDAADLRRMATFLAEAGPNDELMVPGTEFRRPHQDLAVKLMCQYRDAIHRRMGWGPGTLVR